MARPAATAVQPRFPAGGPSVVTTVPVGSYPEGIAYDAAKGEVFVANINSGNVSVISDATDAVVATILIGSGLPGPNAVAYDPARGEVFVTDQLADDVSVINDTTDTVVATIPVGSAPSGAAYDAASGSVFVSNDDSSNISVISDATNKVVATILLGYFPDSSPFGAAYDSAKGQVFFTQTSSSNGASNVSIINGSSDKLVAWVPAGLTSFGAAYDGAMGEVFVTNLGSNDVSVINDTTDTVVSTIPVPPGSSPYGVAYDGAKNLMFVTNQRSASVSVISTVTDTIEAIVPVGSYPFGVAIDAGKGEAFVANGPSNSVSVISDDFQTYPVTFATNPTSCGSITFNAVAYGNGGAVLVAAGSYGVLATPCAGYSFSGLTGTGSVSVTAETAMVEGAGGVTATFVPSYPVTIATDPISCGSVTFNGIVLTNGMSVEVSAGNYHVTTSPCSGYRLLNLTGTGSVSLVSGTALVSGPGGITATFESNSSAVGLLGLPGNEGYYVVAVVVAGGIAAIAGLILIRRRRSGRTSANSPPRSGNDP